MANTSSRTDTPAGADLPKVTPLEGTTTVDDKMTFEPERLSYAAARQVAAEIAVAVESVVAASVVVIANDAFLADLGNLGTAKLQLDLLTADYRSVTAALTAPKPPAPAGPAPGARAAGPAGARASIAVVPALAAGLQTALGLVSLFRENVEFHGTVTRIDPRAFDIAIAAALSETKTKGKAKTVFVPDLMVVRAPLTGPDSLKTKLEAMQEARHAAWQAVGPLLADLGRKDVELDAASRTGPKERIEALSNEILELRKAVEPLTGLLTSADRRFNDLQTQWDKPSEATGLTLIARLFRAEAIDALGPSYLHAAVVSSGGHHRISRHLLRMIFLGDGISAMGGVVARWALLTPDGRFEKGDVVAARRSAWFPQLRTADDDGWAR